MKRNLILWVFVAALSMVLFACSKDEPVPTPEPESPEIPQHPEKDWKGEYSHGFITDASIMKIPVSDRGFVLFNNRDEIIIDRDIEPTDWSDLYYVQTRSDDSWEKYSYMLFDGIMADPFENIDRYIALCTKYKFRWNSQFSNIEELKECKPISFLQGYVSVETLTSVDVITEKYFDENHPAGSSMKVIDRVGMYICVMPVFLDSLADSYGLGGPGKKFGLGYEYDKKYATDLLRSISWTMEGFPEKAGEYPMILKVTMNGGEKTWEQRFTIKFVDKQ